MNDKTIIIKFDPRHTGKEVAQIVIKSLNDAIAINQDNYEFLEEMRREFVFGIMGIENLQGRIKYPNTEDPNKDKNGGWL